MTIRNRFFDFFSETKKKYSCCQEEKEQLEFYQKQEISKIKQLVSTSNHNVCLKEETANVIRKFSHLVTR